MTRSMNTKSASARADRVANTLADAAIAHRRGDAATARRLYRKVLKARPGHFKALRLSGALAHETGNLDEAIRLLSAAVRHAPPSETGALEDLGLLHLQTGELDKAEDLLRRALAIKPASLIGQWRRLCRHRRRPAVDRPGPGICRRQSAEYERLVDHFGRGWPVRYRGEFGGGCQR